MNSEQLNQQYGIGQQVVFSEGKGGLPVIQVNNEQAKALISVYGGQVLAFQPAHALLSTWMSSRSCEPCSSRSK